MTAQEWEELLPIMRERFETEVYLQMGKGLSRRQAEEEAMLTVERVRAWRRRGCDSKPCERCGELVLWRREGSQSKACDRQGRLHGC